MSMNIEFTGDWEKLFTLAKNMQKHYKAFIEVTLNEQGKITLNRILDHIERQDLSWKPLATSTIQLKGGSTEIYLDTGGLYNAFTSSDVQGKGTKDMYVTVGVQEGARTKEGVPYERILFWMEYGTDKMPPRSLIRATWEELQPQFEKMWQDVMKEFFTTGDVIEF